MPTLKLYVFHYEGPEPQRMLEQAIATIFPDGAPAGANVTTIVDQGEPVDEPTDLEPLDEPTELAPPDPPTATAPPATRGKIAEQRAAAVAWLKANGPASRADVGRACGIAKGSVPFAFRHPLFTITDEGLLWLADQPEPPKTSNASPPPRVALPPVARPVKPAAAESEERPLARPVIVPPRRGPGRRAQPREEPSGESMPGLVVEYGAVALCRDAISAELVVMEPQRADMLARRTKFSEAIVAEALKCNRFRKTTGGYALAAAKADA